MRCLCVRVSANCGAGKGCYAEFEKTRFHPMGYYDMGFGSLLCPMCRREVDSMVGRVCHISGYVK